MPNASIKAKQINGLIPALDPRVVEQPFVVRGQNFLNDLLGIHSYFNSEIVSYSKRLDSPLLKTFNVDGQLVVLGQGNASVFDNASGRFLIAYIFTDDGSIFPWTMAKVGNFYFFAKQGVPGILKYDPTIPSWKIFSLNLPTGVCAVSLSVGRLVALGSSFVAWSSQDDGEDFAPSTVTGAGFQGLSIIGGTGITVKQVTDGFITFTTAGTIKSEFTNGPAPFRHYPFDRKIVPLNPFCVVDTQDNTHVVMDRKGLFSSSGQPYQPFEPLMGEYFAHKLAEKLDLSLSTAFRLSYVDCKKFLFVSIGSINFPDRCEQSFCFYIPKGQWSLFFGDHFQILDMDALKGVNNSCQFGFSSPDGYLRHCLETTNHEQSPPLFVDLNSFVEPYVEYPPIIADDVTVFRTGIQFSTEDYTLANSGAGLYRFVYGTGLTTSNITPPVLQAVSKYQYSPIKLESFIEIGMFRYELAQYPDEIGLVTNVALGVDKQTGFVAFEDWESGPTNVVEDLETSTLPNEDYTSDPVVVSDYQVSMYGTTDGTDVFEDNSEVLYLEDESSSTRYYSCYVNGIYHILRVELVAPNQAYYIKNVEISGMMAGRLHA